MLKSKERQENKLYMQISKEKEITICRRCSSLSYLCRNLKKQTICVQSERRLLSEKMHTIDDACGSSKIELQK